MPLRLKVSTYDLDDAGKERRHCNPPFKRYLLPQFFVPYSQPEERFATMEALPSTQTSTSIPGPFALSSWLSANAENLKPPVNNSCLYSGKDFILMAVGGPNTRNDYHSKSFEDSDQD